jgi:hypothetical protein
VQFAANRQLRICLKLEDRNEHNSRGSLAFVMSKPISPMGYKKAWPTRHTRHGPYFRLPPKVYTLLYSGRVARAHASQNVVRASLYPSRCTQSFSPRSSISPAQSFDGFWCSGPRGIETARAKFRDFAYFAGETGQV